MGIFSPFRMKHMAAPPTPAAGESLLYPKDDGRWYTKGVDGFEAPAIGINDDTGWITPTFENGWVSNAAPYSCQYRRLNGVVHVRGLINSGTVSPAGLAAFTLPVGFRPASRSLFNTRTNSVGGSARVEVFESGGVSVEEASSTSWVSVEFSFPVNQPTSFVVGDDTGWIVPAFQNGWTNYASGWSTVAYRRVNGITYIRGLAKGGTAAASIFTLPVGFRPAMDYHMPVNVTDAGDGSYQVYADGRVHHRSGGTIYFSLDGASFPAENTPVAFVPTGNTALFGRMQHQIQHNGADGQRFVQLDSTTGAGQHQVWWTYGLAIYSTGRDQRYFPDGYHNIIMPATGLVIEKRSPNGSQTVTSGTIRLIGSDTLYYEVPLGVGASVPGKWFIHNDQTDNSVIPENWIKIVSRAYGAYGPVVWWDGREDTGWIDLPLINNWLQYDTASFRARYRRINGIVYLDGLVKKTVGLTTEPVTTLPAGFRPAMHLIFANQTSDSTKITQTYVRPTGNVEFAVNGSGIWTSLSGISFPVAQ